MDYRLPLIRIAPLLARLSREEVPAEKEGAHRTVPEDMEFESKMADLDPAGIVGSDYQIGELSQFTCPDCTGPLYEIRDGKLLRYRCRVGHAYTAESLLDGKTEVLEGDLWAALNTLKEGATMSRRLASESRNRGYEHAPPASRNGRGGTRNRRTSSAKRSKTAAWRPPKTWCSFGSRLEEAKGRSPLN